MLVSGSGTNLQALLDHPVCGPRIALVLSDRPGGEGAGTGGVARRRVGRARAEGLRRTRGVRPGRGGSPPRSGDRRRRDRRVHATARLRRCSMPTRGRWLNVHPSLLPAFPGMHGVADALAYGVKVTGVTVFLVDEGTDTGPVVLQEAIEVRRRRRLGLAGGARARGRAPSAPGGHRGVGRGTPPARRPEGDDRRGVDVTDVREVRRALLAVYDKARRGRAGPGPRRAGCLARVVGRDRGHSSRRRVGGHARRGGDRLPRDARRAGEDAASADPRRVAGRQPQARAPGPADRARDRAVRPRRRQPLPVPGDGCVRRRRGRRDREDRHRRARDGPRRREELRVRGRRRGPGRAMRTYSRSSAAAAGSHATRASASPRPRSPTPPRTTPRSPDGSPRRATRTRLPGFVGLALEKVGDLRYGENPHQRGALYRDAGGRLLPDRSGGAIVLQGKDMSFNNWLDADAAYSLVGRAPSRPPA